MCVTTIANSESGAQDAEFTNVSYLSKIPTGINDVWTFTVKNNNCPDNGPNASRFFMKVFADDGLILNEYNDTQYKTWPCKKDNTVSRNYRVNQWQAIRPATHDIRAELYWTDNSTFVLEDTTSFSISVTLYIPLQHIYATGCLAAYLIACAALFSYDYILGLEE